MEIGAFMVEGVQYVSMKAEEAKTAHSCPQCSESTSIVHLGYGPVREVCGRRGCDWNGVTLSP